MRAIDSAVFLADQFGKRLVVFWGRDRWLNCRYADLFRPSYGFDVIEERQWLGKKSPFPYLPGSKPTSLVKSSLYALTKAALQINSEIWYEDIEHAVAQLDNAIQPQNIKKMADYDAQSLKHIKPLLQTQDSKGSSFICSAWKLSADQSYAQHFVPTNALLNQITSLSNHFTNTVGVHIRRSDHTASIKYSTLEKFIKAMDFEAKENNANFFLATDCKETENEILKQFPGKVTTYQKDSFSRNTVQGIQGALIDLYCLSKTDKILGSYYSSFSQVAAELSGIEEITIH